DLQPAADQLDDLAVERAELLAQVVQRLRVAPLCVAHSRSVSQEASRSAATSALIRPATTSWVVRRIGIERPSRSPSRHAVASVRTPSVSPRGGGSPRARATPSW